MNTDIDSLVHRIVSGYYKITIDNIEYIIKSPNLDIRSRAHFIYRSIIEDNKYDVINWTPDNQIKSLLLFNNIWNDSKEKILDTQHQLLKQTKIDLFLNFSNDKKRKLFKENIRHISSYIEQLYNQKTYFNFLSLDFYAKTIENQFMILNMVYMDSDRLLFDQDSENINSVLFNRIIEEVQKNIINMDIMKNIVKSDVWRNYWSASKDNIFDGPAHKWTEEQLTLVNLSKTYDAIREHLESPSEDIINDDDALDGWILYQNDKAEKEKKKQKLEDKYGLNNKKGSEVFILTDSVDEAKEIFELNDPQSKAKINQLKQIYQTGKETKWAEVPFVKQELQQISNSNRKG